MTPVTKTTVETPDPCHRVNALPDSAVVGTRDLMAFFGCSDDTIERMERRGDIPRHFKNGHVRQWILGDVRARQRQKAASADSPR